MESIKFFFRTEPNWIVLIIVSTFLTIIIMYCSKYIYTVLKGFVDKNRFCGDWFGYYIIHEGNNINIKREEWTVTPSVDKNNLNVKIKTVQGGKLNFSGVLYEESGMIILNVKAVEYNETVLCRYPLPIPNQDRLLVGLFLGLDFDGCASAGPTIVSRDVLDDDKIKELVNANIEIFTENKVMRLKRIIK